MSRLRVRFACLPGSPFLAFLEQVLPCLDSNRFDWALWTPPPHSPVPAAGLGLRRWLRIQGCDVLHVPDARPWPRWFSRGLAQRVIGPADSAHLHWGIDLQRLDTLASLPLNPHPPARRGSVTVLVPCPLESGAGHDVLWAALRPLEQGRPLDFWLVGDGSEHARVARKAGRFRTAVRVHLLGARDDRIGLLRRADFTVIPGEPMEGALLPLPLLESRALGRPVVATAGPGVPEAVTPAEDGLLVPPGDPLALARALARLATCEDLRRELGESAARDARRRFDARDTAQALESLYLEPPGRRMQHPPAAIRPAVSS